MKKRYKFLKLVDGKIKSNSGYCTWKIGEWKHEDVVELCYKGFHCSKKMWQAFSYVQGEILAEVEVKGDSKIEDDKEVYSDMRILRAWKWQKKDSVALSIYSAELCIHLFEKIFPNDKRPREAIDAAKKWLLEPTEENRSAAWSASARSARSASASAAWSASARSARSARSAAWSASEEAAAAASASARSAAWSARSATESAAIFTKICKWFDSHLPNLEPYEQN